MLSWENISRRGNVSANQVSIPLVYSPVAKASTVNTGSSVSLRFSIIDSVGRRGSRISIPAGTSAITQALITDKRLDDTVCGITVSTVQHIPTASFLEQMLAEFNDWFLTVKGKLSEDAAGNLLQMIQALSFTIEFEAGDWTVGDSECTITIPAITHGMAGDVVDCKAFALVSGVYEAGAWAAFETYATIDASNVITLHYPGSSGYAGRAVLSAYEADPLA